MRDFLHTIVTRNKSGIASTFCFPPISVTHVKYIQGITLIKGQFITLKVGEFT